MWWWRVEGGVAKWVIAARTPLTMSQRPPHPEMWQRFRQRASSTQSSSSEPQDVRELEARSH